MRKLAVLAGIITGVIVCLALKQPTANSSIGASYCLQYFQQGSIQFAEATKQLQQVVAAISKDSNTIIAAKKQLAACRKSYKNIEFFVEYFMENRIRIFNPAPVYEIEEPYMEFQHPIGMQAIEAILFSDEILQQKEELKAQAEVMHTTAENMLTYLHGKEIRDAQILDALQLELIRIYTLGISGYDAPELKTGITEAKESMQAIKQVIQPYLLHQKNDNADSISFYLNGCLQQLIAHPDFNSFNRMQFFTSAALPLQQQLNALAKDLGYQNEQPTFVNSDAPHLFSPASICKINVDTTTPPSPELIALGKKLFSETALSGNGLRSCATCHHPEKYFTDGLVKSIAFNGKDRVQRNAPSLLYAAYQHNQFLEGRAADLPTQMLAVLQSPLEMNARPATVIKKLKAISAYQPLFASAFSAAADSLISIANIARAISGYEQSFPVQTAALDRYMQGDKTALNKNEIQGFNLFMGKGMCGTCHFAPLFNGLLPPAYDITEVESLGLTKNANFKKPVADKDSGRYGFFPIAFYIGAFKTPTVRNVAKTAPYMHNGAFATLQQVLTFYNQGGGNGLGLHNPHQTLSDKPLHLSPKEMTDIIYFLKALTDEPADTYTGTACKQPGKKNPARHPHQ